MRRVAVVAIALGLLLNVTPPASGWSNGTEGCNSYSTHDWILKKALVAVGNDASWVQAHHFSVRAVQVILAPHCGPPY